MFDQLKQINEARKLASKLEEKNKQTVMKVEHKGITLDGNASEIKSIFYTDEAIKSDDFSKHLVFAINKYNKDSENIKQKNMTEIMGGISGMMNMLKGAK